MIKLQEFAQKIGISDRQVLRLVKKYAEELEGHVERRGSAGTWLDETAQEIIQSKTKQASMGIVDTDLVAQITELKQMLSEKELECAKLKASIMIQEETQKLLEEKVADKEQLKLEYKEAQNKIEEAHQREVDLVRQLTEAEAANKILLNRSLWQRIRNVVPGAEEQNERE